MLSFYMVTQGDVLIERNNDISIGTKWHLPLLFVKIVKNL